MEEQQPKFQLQIKTPYTTFQNGEPTRIPYLCDGLLPEGGFSVLGAKPKMGKSSLARCLAVCVSKGIEFLGRATVRGEVLLVSLEDQQILTDNHLKVLGYDPAADAAIHIVGEIAPKLEQTISAVEDAVKALPNLRLVIIDTLPKALRISDLDDYMPMLTGVEQLRNLARRFQQLHVMALTHCKKVKCDDPFDALLGSTALRGEPDTNIAIFKDAGHHIIATETRMGRNILPSILRAELVESGGANLVREFSLGADFEQWKDDAAEKAEKRDSFEEQIINFLFACENHTASEQTVLKEIRGRKQYKVDAIRNLKDANPPVLIVSGEKQSPTNPTKLTLDRNALKFYDLSNGEFRRRETEGTIQ